eukprot:TRINITY_DN106534_c0_g1_i1.p1 TRINITY_DN106534_c0_g1~~TRINITY_DN106534_c0_g1_i1.p1  ORF type:complete len:268 (+),score=50.62 TRINITY_DN106534_c0_g1_i1:112-915(+)
MPPKPLEPAAEAADESEGTAAPRGPTLFGLQLSEQKIRMAGGLEMDSPENLLRRRNAMLEQDQTMIALKTSLSAPSFNPSVQQSFGNKWQGRSEGTEGQETFIRTMSPSRPFSTTSNQFRPSSPGMQRIAGSTSSAGAMRSVATAAGIPARLAPMESPTPVLSHSMTRLMQDMELAQEIHLMPCAHRLRCTHLDKMHRWFETHRGKDRKQKHVPAPHFLTFGQDDRVMTGSLRVEADERRYAPLPWATVKQMPGWLSKNRQLSPASP